MHVCVWGGGGGSGVCVGMGMHILLYTCVCVCFKQLPLFFILQFDLPVAWHRCLHLWCIGATKLHRGPIQQYAEIIGDGIVRCQYAHSEFVVQK